MSTITLKEQLQASRELAPLKLRAELRKARGVSQDAVAREVSRLTGGRCTRRSVSTWEQGTRKPTGANLVAYVIVLRMLASEGFDAEEPAA